MTALSLLLSRDALLPAESDSTSIFDDLPPVRLVKVPDAAPPFDGEPTAQVPRGVGHEALHLPLPPQAPSSPLPVPRTGADRDRGTTAVRASGSEGPGDWPPRFARLLTEVLSGYRPPQQIMPWLTQRARYHLRRLTPAFSSGQRPRVLRVLSSQPSATVVEISVIISIGTRTRALAFRLEQAKGQPARWLCTDIEAA